MVHTTLSQGKYSTQGKGLFEPKCKGQDQDIVIESRRKGQEHSLLSEPKCKGQKQVIVIESRRKGQEHSLLSEPQCKGQRHCRPGSKDRVTNHLYAY